MLALCGCKGHYASPDGRDHPYVQAAIEESPPTLQDAATATYWGGQARQITLTEGAYAGPEGQRVELERQHYVVGDLEGDGAVDAVVTLVASNAGAENGHYLAVLRHLDTDTINLGTAFLGNTVDVQAVTIDQRRIIVDLMGGDVGNTSERRRVIYELRRGALDQVSDTAR
jgi:hypothetical protein